MDDCEYSIEITIEHMKKRITGTNFFENTYTSTDGWLPLFL